MFKTQRQPVVVGNADEGAQRLVNKHLPSSGKHLAPTTFTVSNITFVVHVVKPSMGHQVMVSTAEIPLVKTTEELPVLRSPGNAGNVVGDRCSPSFNHIVNGEGSVSVKPCVKARVPPFRVS